MVKTRMRKTMKKKKINKIKKNQKHSRKHKKTVKQRRHYKQGGYSRSFKGGQICLKEVTNNTPPEVVNRIDNPSMGKGLFSSFGSYLGFGKNKSAPSSENEKRIVPVVKVESDNTKNAQGLAQVVEVESDNTKNTQGLAQVVDVKSDTPPSSSITQDTSVVSSSLKPGEEGFIPPPPPPGTSEAGQTVENERLKKYIIYKNGGVSEDTIRNKMRLDGLTEDEINNFFSSKLSASALDNLVPKGSEGSEAGQTVVNERLKKYIILKNGGVKEDVIRNKMLEDGFLQDDIDVVLGSDPSASASSRPPPPPPRIPNSATEGQESNNQNKNKFFDSIIKGVKQSDVSNRKELPQNSLGYQDPLKQALQNRRDKVTGNDEKKKINP